MTEPRSGAEAEVERPRIAATHNLLKVFRFKCSQQQGLVRSTG